MSRVNATSTDIYARLAKGECANYLNGCCLGRAPCAVVVGEACQYFNDYVKPLLDGAELSQRYAREAKIKLAINPETKVVRKQRPAGAPAPAAMVTVKQRATDKQEARKPGESRVLPRLRETRDDAPSTPPPTPPRPQLGGIPLTLTRATPRETRQPAASIPPRSPSDGAPRWDAPPRKKSARSAPTPAEQLELVLE